MLFGIFTFFVFVVITVIISSSIGIGIGGGGFRWRRRRRFLRWCRHGGGEGSMVKLQRCNLVLTAEGCFRGGCLLIRCFSCQKKWVVFLTNKPRHICRKWFKTK